MYVHIIMQIKNRLFNSGVNANPLQTQNQYRFQSLSQHQFVQFQQDLVQMLEQAHHIYGSLNSVIMEQFIMIHLNFTLALYMAGIITVMVPSIFFGQQLDTKIWRQLALPPFYSGLMITQCIIHHMHFQLHSIHFLRSYHVLWIATHNGRQDSTMLQQVQLVIYKHLSKVNRT